MSEEVLCPTCGGPAEHLIGRLYRCNSCKSPVKNWIEPESPEKVIQVSKQTTG